MGERVDVKYIPFRTYSCREVLYVMFPVSLVFNPGPSTVSAPAELRSGPRLAGGLGLATPELVRQRRSRREMPRRSNALGGRAKQQPGISQLNYSSRA